MWFFIFRIVNGLNNSKFIKKNCRYEYKQLLFLMEGYLDFVGQVDFFRCEFKPLHNRLNFDRNPNKT